MVTLGRRLVDKARQQAERGVVGSNMEGHGEMDMSITEGPFLRRLFSARAFTAISHYFYMDAPQHHRQGQELKEELRRTVNDRWMPSAVHFVDRLPNPG
jgi:hypothetical protein